MSVRLDRKTTEANIEMPSLKNTRDEKQKKFFVKDRF